MKIVLIRRKFTTKASGGAEKTAANFAEGMIAKGHQVYVMSEQFNAEKSDSLKWVEVPKKRSVFGGTWAFHCQVQKLLKSRWRHKADIVYALCRTFPVDVMRVTEQLHHVWLPMHYSKFQRFNPRHSSILCLEKLLFNTHNCKEYITNSELVKNQLIANFKLPEDKISVVNNGVNSSIFYPGDLDEINKQKAVKNINPDNFVFIFVANNFKIKGLDSVIKALAKLSPEIQSQLSLLVVGGDDPAPYKKLASQLKFKGQLKFTGKQKEMRDCYICADLMIYPSLYEPFGNVCLEAAACGVPSVTTPLNGSSQLIEPGKSGYIVHDFSDTEELKNIVFSYVTLPPEERQQIAIAAYEASCAYTWQNHVDQVEAVFQRIIAEKQRPGR